jgi:PAS domain S-box-containing protein
MTTAEDCISRVRAAARNYSQPVAPARPFGFASFERVVESCGCPVLIVASGSPEQSIIYASHAFLRLTGYRAADVCGWGWSQFFDGDGTDSRAQAFRIAIRNGSEMQGLLSAKHRSGSTLYLDVKMAPLRTEMGLVTHHVAALHDVTVRRELLGQPFQLEVGAARVSCRTGSAPSFEEAIDLENLLQAEEVRP